MFSVIYTHRFEYTYDDQTGSRFPRLTLSIGNPAKLEQALDVDAYLDSGAQRSLFDGRLGKAIGFEILAGKYLKYKSTIGNGISARLHAVRLVHPSLGSFDLEVGFALENITRNLLGRDFFNLLQVGFRERQSTFYMVAQP